MGDVNNTRGVFASRLGFLLVAAGCAVGLGNVWRFPFITGQCGGAIFVLIYIVFLFLLGIPILTVELAIGRSSGCSVVKAFTSISPNFRRWGVIPVISMFGLYMLMSYYSVIAGWLVYYFVQVAEGSTIGLSQTEIGAKFNSLQADPYIQLAYVFMVIATVCFICYRGLQNGVEKITKYCMVGMFLIMIVMAVNSLTLEGASAGMSFYLKPDLEAVEKVGWFNVILNAMTQVFFSLSVGIGSILIFGSYISKKHSLIKESSIIAILDTIVALLAGVIIFPACYTYGIKPDVGPTLVFQTMIQMFNQMPNGRIWGSVFFLFLSIAALTTVVAVIEGIIAGCMELFNWSRHKSAMVNFVVIPLLSVPVILGFNQWSGFTPLGSGSNILDLCDFIVTNNVLPIGALLMVMFCGSKTGWGWNGYVNEVNSGSGIKLPGAEFARIYYKYFVVSIIIVLLLTGYYGKFFA
ncbi:MAG: sodium-dependent transporter [Ruminobacter sp.]|nr:sodium-dependent transporter [Ruminobacter sp.]